MLCICGNLTHLATGSFDRTINIWLLKDGKLYQTLVGHTKGVWAVKFLSPLLLISGAYDATIKVRKQVEEFDEEKTLEYSSFGISIRVSACEHSCHIKVPFGH